MMHGIILERITHGDTCGITSRIYRELMSRDISRKNTVFSFCNVSSKQQTRWIPCQ